MSIMNRCEKAFARYDDVHSQIVSAREKMSDDLIDLGHGIAMMQVKYVMECWKENPRKMIGELKELVKDSECDAHSQCKDIVESGTIEVLENILI